MAPKGYIQACAELVVLDLSAFNCPKGCPLGLVGKLFSTCFVCLIARCVPLPCALLGELLNDTRGLLLQWELIVLRNASETNTLGLAAGEHILSHGMCRYWSKSGSCLCRHCTCTWACWLYEMLQNCQSIKAALSADASQARAEGLHVL